MVAKFFVKTLLNSQTRMMLAVIRAISRRVRLLLEFLKEQFGEC